MIYTIPAQQQAGEVIDEQTIESKEPEDDYNDDYDEHEINEEFPIEQSELNAE